MPKLSVSSFDELNQLVGYERSMPIDKFFDEMRISESQKKQRKQLARRLQSEFDFMMAYLFYLQQADAPIANMDIVNEFIERYTDAVGILIPMDMYVMNRIQRMSAEIVDVTNRHRDDPYFYSKDRSRLIAENESNTLYSYDEFNEESLTARAKQWLTIIDGKERDSHAEVNGVIVPIDEPFELRGGYVLFPRDDSLSASDEELCGCRCSIRYIK